MLAAIPTLGCHHCFSSANHDHAYNLVLIDVKHQTLTDEEWQFRKNVSTTTENTMTIVAQVLSKYGSHHQWLKIEYTI